VQSENSLKILSHQQIAEQERNSTKYCPIKASTAEYKKSCFQQQAETGITAGQTKSRAVHWAASKSHVLGAAANRHTPGVERPDLIVVILRRRFASYQDKTTTIGGQSISVIYTDSIHTFIGPSSRTTQVSQYQKGKTNQETVSGSVISLAICKPAPRCRQITMPAPHLSVLTGRMPFLPPNQQSQSTEGIYMQTRSSE